MSFYSVDFDGSREQAAKIGELAQQCLALKDALAGVAGAEELAAGLDAMSGTLKGISDDVYAATAARQQHDEATLDTLDPFPEFKHVELEKK